MVGLFPFGDHIITGLLGNQMELLWNLCGKNDRMLYEAVMILVSRIYLIDRAGTPEVMKAASCKRTFVLKQNAADCCAGHLSSVGFLYMIITPLYSLIS